MNVLRGTNAQAAAIASALLESDLSFHTVLTSGVKLLIFGTGPDGSDPEGTLQLWWTVEMETKADGVYLAQADVTRLVLDGNYQTIVGRRIVVGEPFYYEYPEVAQRAAIGSDVDAPTAENVHRLAEKKWKVTWSTDIHGPRLRITPSADVDLDRRTIEIAF